MLKTKNGRSTDMTEGNILRHLISFAFPLLIGHLFQQLYNTVDAWVVGNYVSNEAFSAVGTLSPITNTLIGFFSGLAGGAGVVVSQFYGAKDIDKVQKAVHTAMSMTVILGILFTIIGVVTTPMMLGFTETPADVYPDSFAYLTIYFSGLCGLMIYNMGAGILRAVGDSKRPFIFLVVSAVINTVLDLIFVIVFSWGVKGVAYATIIAQAVSAVLVIITLATSKNEAVRLSIKKLRLDIVMLGKIVKIGIPTALQLAITSFSNVFVQSYINHFGSEFMGGWTAYLKLDAFTMLPAQALSIAVTTFVGQNVGKKDYERAKKGANVGFVVAIVSTVTLITLMMIYAPMLVRFLNKEAGETVINYGTVIIRMLSPFYVFPCVNQIFSGALRGSGNSRVPMIVSLSSFVVFRRVYLYIATTFVANTYQIVSFAYPLGWILCGSTIFIYYKIKGFSPKNSLVEGK